jgi:beta-1,2-mannobiose phosphorylase / 1,2-beta-oligomannan phosphorylase
MRSPANPILGPSQVPASQDDLEVVGVFNPAAVQVGDETLLLLRVAEAPRQVPDGQLAAAVLAGGRIRVERFDRGDPVVEAGTDARVFTVRGQTYLTSISHLRVARSRDGVDFAVAPRPALVAADPLEAFGVEDPRVTALDGAFLVNYTAVSSAGIATALAVTRDFVEFDRKGIIFPPNNRDAAIFPARIAGRACALHRPMPDGIGRPSIWLAWSDDLVHWGGHQLVAGPRAGHWDDLKVGGGAVPFEIPDGWLAIYHGVTSEPMTYSLGALLLDRADPSRVLARSRAPILAPEADYEVGGFFGNVVFTCGALPVGDVVRIYYGAADGVTAVADVPLSEIMDGLA